MKHNLNIEYSIEYSMNKKARHDSIRVALLRFCDGRVLEVRGV